MVQFLNNTEVLRNLDSTLGVQNPNRDTPPVADYVIPAVIANDELFRARTGFCNAAEALNTTTATIMTTSTTEDTFLHALSLSHAFDAAPAAGSSTITSTISGKSTILLRLEHVAPALTDYARHNATSLSLPVPIKIDRGVIVTVTNSAATAVTRASGIVYGFTRPRLS